jgi:hypothetical protein
MRLGERLRALGNLPEQRTYDCAYFCRISVTIEDDREPELPAVNDDVPTVADTPRSAQNKKLGFETRFSRTCRTGGCGRLIAGTHRLGFGAQSTGFSAKFAFLLARSAGGRVAVRHATLAAYASSRCHRGSPKPSTGGRGKPGRRSRVSSYRDETPLAPSYLQPKYLPAVQRKAASSQLVRISQRALRAPHLVVRRLRLRIRDLGVLCRGCGSLAAMHDASGAIAPLPITERALALR